MQPWALVTPASRGIGLALTRHLLRNTSVPVVATGRKKLDELKQQALEGIDGIDESRLHVHEVDVTDEASIESTAQTLKSTFPSKEGHHLHTAFLLPGLLYPEKSPSQINYDDALLTFKTNTLGPLMLIKHLSPLLPRKSTKIHTHELQQMGMPPQAVMALMSARVGSIGDNQLGGWYSYRASKAAVNQVAKTFDNYLKTSAGDNAMCISLHPGTVKTNLSKEFWGNVKEDKLFTPEFSAEKLASVVGIGGVGVGLKGRGKCWDWRGEEIPP